METYIHVYIYNDLQLMDVHCGGAFVLIQAVRELAAGRRLGLLEGSFFGFRRP